MSFNWSPERRLLSHVAGTGRNASAGEGGGQGEDSAASHTRAGLVTRTAHPTDKRGRLVTLTAEGTETLVRAANLHLENIRTHFLAPLPEDHRERFAQDLKILSHAARDALPRLK